MDEYLIEIGYEPGEWLDAASAPLWRYTVTRIGADGTHWRTQSAYRFADDLDARWHAERVKEKDVQRRADARKALRG